MSRVTIDITPAVHQSAGIGRLTREVVRQLIASGTELARTGYDFRLFCMGAPFSQSDQGRNPRDADSLFRDRATNIPVITGKLSDRWMYRLWFRARLPIPVELFAGTSDLYHATDFVLPPVFLHVKTVLTVHDLTFERDPNSAPPRLLPFLKRVVPQSARRATHIVADSLATAHDLSDLYGIPESKITTIYSGVDARFKPATTVSWQPQQDAALRLRYQIGNEPFVLAVGTMQPRKNHLALVRAFSKINIADVNLVIAGGKGWLYEEVLAEIRRLGLSQRVKLIGFVDDADLPALYRAAAVFAFPSLYEGFGLPPLEAMASGVPVVASNASSLPEVIAAAGLLVPPHDVDALADALVRALTDQVWRQQVIPAGIARASQFTWQRAAEQLLEVYRNALL